MEGEASELEEMRTDIVSESRNWLEMVNFTLSKNRFVENHFMSELFCVIIVLCHNCFVSEPKRLAVSVSMRATYLQLTIMLKDSLTLWYCSLLLVGKRRKDVGNTSFLFGGHFCFQVKVRRRQCISTPFGF